MLVFWVDWACERRQGMPRKGFTSEQIIKKLRTAEVELSQGKTVAQVCKKIGITEQWHSYSSASL
jgi:hypothetical protein